MLDFWLEKMNKKFTIHLHEAEKAGRHFDLRIEKDAVLKSWAARKIDQLVKGQVKKILLFQTEDHPLSWLNWEGELKSGYGKGVMTVWDFGTYEEIKWEENIIIIYFHGKKIKGYYNIMSYDVGKRQNSFLMFKAKQYPNHFPKVR